MLLWLLSSVMIIYLLNDKFKYESEDIIMFCVYTFIVMLIIINSPVINLGDIQHLEFNNYLICGENLILVKKFILVIMVVFFLMLSNFCKINYLPIFEYLILILVALFSLFMLIHGNHLFIIFIF